ncbi:MAG: hypothetical protein OXR66_09005 [Candidatus Woesearchaeota archaeon]|nr:hypothetical protein [Candidatus Woesearchaeota archaeon]
MNIRTTEGLEALAEPVEEKVEQALAEREELGLSMPEPFDVHIQFYDSTGIASAIRANESSPAILSTSALGMLYGEQRELVERIITYFQAVQRIMGPQSDEALLAHTASPKKVIAALGEDRRGIKYLKDLAAKATEAIPIVQKAAVEGASTFDYSERHEIDHIDFFASSMYEHFAALEPKKDSTPAQEKKLWGESLAAYVGICAAEEARALFFNYIPLGEMRTADYDSVKTRIAVGFGDGYTRRSALDNIARYAVSKEGVNYETASYVIRAIDMTQGRPTSEIPDEAAIDMEAAGRILYRIIPFWQNRLETNAQRAVEAVGNAYRDDPARLARTTRAESFDHFIELCKP